MNNTDVVAIVIGFAKAIAVVLIYRKTINGMVDLALKLNDARIINFTAFFIGFLGIVSLYLINEMI